MWLQPWMGAGRPARNRIGGNRSQEPNHKPPAMQLVLGVWQGSATIPSLTSNLPTNPINCTPPPQSKKMISVRPRSNPRPSRVSQHGVRLSGLLQSCRRLQAATCGQNSCLRNRREQEERARASVCQLPLIGATSTWKSKGRRVLKCPVKLKKTFL